MTAPGGGSTCPKLAIHKKQVMRSSGRSTSPCAKTSSPSPQGVAELDAERLEEERLEAAQREAEQELEALEARLSGEGGDAGDAKLAVSRVPALLQMAANQAQHDSSLTEQERKERARALLTPAEDAARADSTTEASSVNGREQTKQPSEAEVSNGARHDGIPAAAAGAKTARGEQLESLLCKAEQYSMFIRQSQVDLEESRPIVMEDDEQTPPEKGEDVEEQDAAGTKGGRREGSRKRTAEALPGKGAGAGKRKRGPGKKAKTSSTSGKAFSSAASKMEKAKITNRDDACFRQPHNLVGGKLKPYQLEGLRWLVTLYENGLSGILADEMGLGKTIQVIALIAHLRSKNVNGPFLVTAPLATLPNWVNEFRKWLPSANVLLYHGSKIHRAELRKTVMKARMSRTPGFPIVVTSYEVSIIDRAALQGYKWQYLIIDEGQRIKNASCRLVRELKKLPSENRLLLSGTPIQNTLEELWSLLNFVNPQIFDDLSIFQSWFGFKNIGKETSVEDIVDEQQHSKIVSKLHEILRPFLIRRMKKDVLASDGLLPKCEVVVYAGMTTVQRGYYELVCKNALRETLIKMNIDGASRVSEININMNQRKVCQHPFLFGEPKDKATGEYVGVQNPELLVASSGKLALMDRMLKKLHKGGHKVLIFSQMTSLLDLLEDYLRHRNWDFRRIDGGTGVQDRQRSIDEYNAHPSSIFAFLLSTRAGGLGINLCAADTCILFDSDWNPHQDSQAMARCHRIGQTRPVMVYRLLTSGSVEIDMMEKQISKKKLERVAVQGGDFGKAGRRTHGEMTVSHLRKLLEDDVEDLAKRSSCSGAGDGVDRAITEEELDGILDRDRVFACTSSNWGDAKSNKWVMRWDDVREDEAARKVPPLQKEGDMYDIVDELDASVLSSMG